MIRASVIIPFYNAEKTLPHCLPLILSALRREMEVILVNDGSRDRSLEVAKTFPFPILNLPVRSGAAAARNRGAQEAKGEFLIFVDADTLVHSDTFQRLLNKYEENIGIDGVSAVYSGRPAVPGWFQEFKTLEETCKYRAYRADRYSSFDPHCASIKRQVFFDTGGFNPGYRGADTEDAEFGYALEQKGFLNTIAPEIQVEHIYSPFLKSLWNYFRRSFLWSRLFLGRFKFDQAVTTRKNAASVFLAFAAITTGIASLFLLAFLPVSLLAGGVFLFWNHTLIQRIRERDSLKSCLKIPAYSVFLLILHAGVGTGAGAGFCYWPLRGMLGALFQNGPKLEDKKDLIVNPAHD